MVWDQETAGSSPVTPTGQEVFVLCAGSLAVSGRYSDKVEVKVQLLVGVRNDVSLVIPEQRFRLGVRKVGSHAVHRVQKMIMAL